MGTWNKRNNGEPLTSTGTITASANGNSDEIDVRGLLSGSMQFVWEDIDAFDARVILQGSNDGTNWNDFGGDGGGIIMLLEDDSQVWEFKEFTTKFVRLDYTANDVTTGTLNWYFEGLS